MKKIARLQALSAVVLATMGVGCKPNAPTANMPATPAQKVVTKEDPALKLRIPKIEKETPPAETADSPPAPTPESPPVPTPTPLPSNTPPEPTPPATPEPTTPEPAIPSPKKLAGPALADALAPRFSYEHPVTVKMSEDHRGTCLVKVDATFPSLTFVDAKGEKVSLASHYGERLTIVVFWNNGRKIAREQFERMQREIAASYGIAGVSIVAINVGDSVPTVQKILANSPQKFACLLDPDQEAFKKIATNKLPRTYLLDKNGKILWLDIEYSRDMLRELDNAVHLFLKEKS